MDASAYIETEKWEEMKVANKWNEIDVRDNRYNHIIHMVSAANGADKFYSTEVSIKNRRLSNKLATARCEKSNR